MSVSFVTMIYELTKEFPKSEIYGITNQLRRAAVSMLKQIHNFYKSKKRWTVFLLCLQIWKKKQTNGNGGWKKAEVNGTRLKPFISHLWRFTMKMVVYLTFVTASVAFAISDAVLFAGMRERLRSWNPWLGKLASCGYCLRHWEAWYGGHKSRRTYHDILIRDSE